MLEKVIVKIVVMLAIATAVFFIVPMLLNEASTIAMMAGSLLFVAGIYLEIRLGKSFMKKEGK